MAKILVTMPDEFLSKVEMSPIKPVESSDKYNIKELIIMYKHQK